jgi:hypothetical protein
MTYRLVCSAFAVLEGRSCGQLMVSSVTLSALLQDHGGPAMLELPARIVRA